MDQKYQKKTHILSGMTYTHKYPRQLIETCK